MKKIRIIKNKRDPFITTRLYFFLHLHRIGFCFHRFEHCGLRFLRGLKKRSEVNNNPKTKRSIPFFRRTSLLRSSSSIISLQVLDSLSSHFFLKKKKGMDLHCLFSVTHFNSNPIQALAIFISHVSLSLSLCLSLRVAICVPAEIRFLQHSGIRVYGLQGLHVQWPTSLHISESFSCPPS